MAIKNTTEIENLTAEIERLKGQVSALLTDLENTKLTVFATTCANSPIAYKAYNFGLSEDRLRDRLAARSEFLSAWDRGGIENGFKSGRLCWENFTRTKIDDFNWVLVNREKRLWVPF